MAAAEPNFALAFGLTTAAGLSTSLGAALVFAPQFYSKKVLAVCLAFAAGVMVYVSFVEIFVKGLDEFTAHFDAVDGINTTVVSVADYSPSSTAYHAATAMVFVGILVTYTLDHFVHFLYGLQNKEGHGHGHDHVGLDARHHVDENAPADGYTDTASAVGREDAAAHSGAGLADAQATALPSPGAGAGDGGGTRGYAHQGKGTPDGTTPVTPGTPGSASRRGRGASGTSMQEMFSSDRVHLHGGELAEAILTMEGEADADAAAAVAAAAAAAVTGVAAEQRTVSGHSRSAGSLLDAEANPDTSALASLAADATAVRVADERPTVYTTDVTVSAVPQGDDVARKAAAGARDLASDGGRDDLARGAADASGDSAARVDNEGGVDALGISSQMLIMALITGTAVALHNFPEGLATFVATAYDPSVGAPIAIAIAVHNVPEGVAVAVPIYFATRSKAKAFLWGTASGLAEPVAGLFGWAVLAGGGTDLGSLTYATLFGLVCGMMIYISFRELLPTARRHDPDDEVVTNSVFAGMAVMAASLMLFVA